MLTLTDKTQIHTTTVENDFLDVYLAKASGENIKVFLMLLRMMQASMEVTPALLAGRLDMTEGAVKRALDYWKQEGMIASSEDATAQVVEDASAITTRKTPEKKNLSSAQLRRKQKDEKFKNLIYITQTYIGHPLTITELNSLCYIYDDLKLPVELIEYLIEYCVGNHKTSLRYMEAVAINWHEKGITTIKQAKSNSASYQKEYYTIMNALGLSGQPAPAQVEFMEQWLYKDGFSLNLILEACKRTITATGNGSFPYANGILSSWKKNGIHSMSEVEAADQRFAAENAAKKRQPKQSANTQKPIHNFTERSYDFDALEQRYIEKINQP